MARGISNYKWKDWKMSDELNKPDKKDLEQDLLGYLHGKMSDQEQHAFEQQLNEDEFLNDAAEGLEGLKNKKDLSLLVMQLNSDLKKQIDKKKKQKEKRKITGQPMVYLTIILLLLLITIAFVVIKNFL